MSDKTAVRLATTDDLIPVIGLLAQLAPDWQRASLPPTADDVERSTWLRILADEDRIIYVALRGGTVVGVVDVVIVRTLLDGVAPHAIVDALVVEAALRGEGIGRALMTEARRRAEEIGCSRLELLSSKGLDQAHAFYSQLGYESTAEGFRHWLR